MMLHTKYQGKRPCGFRQDDFSCFSLYEPMINLVGLLDDATHTKYQGSRSYGFRQEVLFPCFLYISLCKQCVPGGRGHFWPEGHN